MVKWQPGTEICIYLTGYASCLLPVACNLLYNINSDKTYTVANAVSPINTVAIV